MLLEVVLVSPLEADLLVLVSLAVHSLVLGLVLASLALRLANGSSLGIGVLALC